VLPLDRLLLSDIGDIVQASPFEPRYHWLLQHLPGRQSGDEPRVPTMPVAWSNLLMSSCQRPMLMDVATLQSEFAVQFHDEAGHVRCSHVSLRWQCANVSRGVLFL